MATQASEIIPFWGLDTEPDNFLSYYFSSSTQIYDGMDNACPQSCVQDRIRFITQPRTWESDKRFLEIKIMFEQVRRVTETYVTYTWPDLLADMGGYMGLLLGWSLLSLYEGGQNLAVSVFRRLRRRVGGRRRRRRRRKQ